MITKHLLRWLCCKFYDEGSPDGLSPSSADTCLLVIFPFCSFNLWKLSEIPSALGIEEHVTQPPCLPSPFSRSLPCLLALWVDQSWNWHLGLLTLCRLQHGAYTWLKGFSSKRWTVWWYDDGEYSWVVKEPSRDTVLFDTLGKMVASLLRYLKSVSCWMTSAPSVCSFGTRTMGTLNHRHNLIAAPTIPFWVKPTQLSLALKMATSTWNAPRGLHRSSRPHGMTAASPRVRSETSVSHLEPPQTLHQITSDLVRAPPPSLTSPWTAASWPRQPVLLHLGTSSWLVWIQEWQILRLLLCLQPVWHQRRTVTSVWWSPL